MSRKILVLTAAILFSLPLILAQCGSSGGEVALDDLAAEMGKAVCAKAYQCCTDLELTDFQGDNFTDEASCASFYAGGISTYVVTPMKNAIDEGRGTYDAGKAQKCIDAYNGLGCTGTNDANAFFDNCETPYVGTQQTGDACNTVMECAAPHYCSTNTKTCEEFVAENGTCGATGEPYCEGGLWCNAEVCEKQKAANSVCATDIECELGLECDDVGLTCTAIEAVCTGRN
jgi:hypothetical protein